MVIALTQKIQALKHINNNNNKKISLCDPLTTPPPYFAIIMNTCCFLFSVIRLKPLLRLIFSFFLASLALWNYLHHCWNTNGLYDFLSDDLSGRNSPWVCVFFLIYNPCQIIVFPCKSEKLLYFKIWNTLKSSFYLSLVFCGEKFWKHNEHMHTCVSTKGLWKNKQCFCLVQRQSVWEGASLIMGLCFIFPW